MSLFAKSAKGKSLKSKKLAPTAAKSEAKDPPSAAVAAGTAAAGHRWKDGNLSREASCLRMLGLQLVPVAPDGNCLFRAFSVALFGNQDEHARLRSQAVGYIRRNPAQFAPFFADSSLDEHIAKMTASATWGGEAETVALAQALGADVRVVRSDDLEFDDGETVSPAAPSLTACSVDALLPASILTSGPELAAEANDAGGEADAATVPSIILTFHRKLMGSNHYNAVVVDRERSEAQAPAAMGAASCEGYGALAAQEALLSSAKPYACLSRATLDEHILKNAQRSHAERLADKKRAALAKASLSAGKPGMLL